jgi:hypothetical protein
MKSRNAFETKAGERRSKKKLKRDWEKRRRRKRRKTVADEAGVRRMMTCSPRRAAT